MTLTSVLKQLEQERSRLSSELGRINIALTALNGASRSTPRKGMSAAGRARIAAAQRARWAKVKGKISECLSRAACRHLHGPAMVCGAA
jgi:hypothetical protein